MRTTCPECGHEFDTRAAKGAPVQNLNAMYARFKFEEILVREYIKLFEPESGRPNSISKETRLIGELLKFWDEEYFERGGRGYTTTRDQIKASIEATCNRQPRLRTHGYLLAVLKSRASDTEARAERDQHEKALARTRRATQSLTTAAKAVALSEPFDFEAGKREARKAREKLGFVSPEPWTAESDADGAK
jgi:hypothetical protein